MPNKYVIAGLGAIGTYVTKLLAEQDCEVLYIYDYDKLSKSDLEIFPFYTNDCINKHKVFIFKQYTSIHFPKLEINCYADKFDIDSPPRLGFIYIDCRDKKILDFNFDLRISFDGGILILDSRNIEDIEESFYDDYNYHSLKNKNLLNSAASNCCEYLSNELYKRKELRIFDLTKRTVFNRG